MKLLDAINAFINRIIAWLDAHPLIAKQVFVQEPVEPVVPSVATIATSTPPVAPVEPPKPLPADPVLLWDTPAHAYHSTRVICDNVGLTYEQKNILCQCVMQESGFLTNPRPNQNKDPKTGKVWSTDWGIVQVNDHYNIGPNKAFPSVQYVLDNPDKCIEWMAKIYKETGALKPWVSYTSGVYKRWKISTDPLHPLPKWV